MLLYSFVYSKDIFATVPSYPAAFHLYEHSWQYVKYGQLDIAQFIPLIMYFVGIEAVLSFDTKTGSLLVYTSISN